MKLITLNLWGGRLQADLFPFLARHAKDTDVFCFQEVYNATQAVEGLKIVTDTQARLKDLLKDFDGYYDVGLTREERGVQVEYGLAMYVRQGTSVIRQEVHEIFLKEDEARLHLPEGAYLWNRLLQSVTLKGGSGDLTIFNLHGFWFPGGGKGDMELRLEQSAKVCKIMDGYGGDKVLCGDFNLNPDTQSFAMLADGMRDLVREHGVTSTRSHHYLKTSKFADYVLVSEGVQVREFAVLDDVVSDHLPLALTFAILPTI